MNQEQNNLNPNNFNTQGNNGMPNNQPLNNQNFNQGMGFNQQPINPQPQQTPSYEQPIMQEPTPQSTNNTFEGGNANNRSFNGKPPKKINLGLIIGGIAVIGITIGAIILGPKLLMKNNNNSESNDSKYENVEVADITGKAKFVKNFENYTDISSCGRNYFTLTNDSETIVVDLNGNIVAKGVNSYRKPYCFEDGTIMVPNNKQGESYSSYSYKIFQSGKEVYTFNGKLDNTAAYDSNVVYYTTEDYHLKAYDLKSQKELWTSKDFVGSPILVDNVIIADGTAKDSKYILNKKTGETIDKTNDSYDVHVSYNDYYVRVYKKDNTNWLSSVEVYDYNSNLISNLKINETDKCRWSYMLSNGFYVLNFDQESGTSKYSVYDFNSKLIKSGLAFFDYNSSRFTYNSYIFTSTNILDNDNVSVMEGEYSAPSLLFYKDGKTLEYYTVSDTSSFGLGVGNTGRWVDTEQRTFLLGKDTSYGDNYVITNFLTGNSKQIEVQDLNYLSSVELWGGKYLALNDNGKYTFYDENLNKLNYESDKNIVSINDEWVISYKSNCVRYKSCSPEYYVTNILTGNENKLDINVTYENSYGSTNHVVNRNGLLVKNGTNYELYKFN